VSITHRITESISSDASSAVSGSSSEVGASETNPNALYPAATSNLLITMSFVVANLQSILLVSDKGLTLKTNGTNIADVQTISITGTPTGGSFPLGFGGQVTLLAYNASASDVQVALRALSTIGSPNVTCTGGPLPGTPVVCTFAGTMTPGFQSLITTSSVALTGGSTPTVSIAHTTPGKPSNTLVLGPNIPYKWGKSRNYEACLFTIDVTSAYVSCTPAASLKGKILTS
jgi:hypothetical protein